MLESKACRVNVVTMKIFILFMIDVET